jgi:hypothetical protein
MKTNDVRVGMTVSYDGSECEVLRIGLVPRGYARTVTYDGVEIRRKLNDKTFVVRARQLKAVDPIPQAATEPNAGTCCWCGLVMKVRGDTLVLHGYKRPGHGWIEGQCPGTGTKPYELSPEELPRVRANVERYRSERVEDLARLNSPDLRGVSAKERCYYRDRGRRVPVDAPVTLLPTHPRFRDCLYWEVKRTADQIQMAQEEIVRVQEWFERWAAPMPLLVKA